MSTHLPKEHQLSAPSRIVPLQGDPPDTELVRRCLGGEESCFGTLVERYQTVLYNLALRTVGDRDEALDVTQISFTRVYQRLADFDPRYRFFSWIYRITLNEALKVLRRRQSQAPLSESIPWEGSSPEDDLDRRELSDRIGEALLRLSVDQRLVVILRHFLDLSYGDMAEILEIEEKTVKSRLFSARRRLAGLLLPAEEEA